MYKYEKKNLAKSTVEIFLTLPKADIEKQYIKSFDKLAAELTAPGFRPGKAPKNIAEKQIGKEAVYQELIKSLLPEIYSDLVKKEGLKPIVNPKIELLKAKEGEDWEIKITVAEKPVIDLTNYREIIKKVKAEQKKEDIWVPGKSEKKPEKNEENKQKLLNELLSGLLKGLKIEIPELIVEEELNSRLARLLDDIQKIGLTVDAYFKSKGTTLDETKKRYSTEIEDTYKIEFILSEIADKEGIKVEQADLDKLFNNISDEKEKNQAKQNAYFYASILRKQKALDLILGL